MSIALYTLICTATLAVLAGARQTQYCNLKSCKGEPHSICLYQAGKTSPDCGRVISTGVTEAQKNEILTAHNTLRARVASGAETRGKPGPQPASRNIRPLKWSDELAATAQLWANQCQEGHDKCRDIPEYWVAQNAKGSTVYHGYEPSQSLTSMIQGWYDEVDDFDKNLVKSYNPDGPVVGHYAQLVWGKTTHVGCGLIVFNLDGPWWTTHLVCNYGPGGNVVGAPVY